MRKLIYVFILASSIVLIGAGCSKEGPAGAKGATGAVGAIGANGAAGPTGAQGSPGNANVMQFNYDTIMVNASSSAYYTFPGMTAGILDSSVVMVYYSQYVGQWNVAGGCGPSCLYQTIIYTDPTPFVSVYLQNPDGSAYSGAGVLWLKSRLIIIPASEFGKRELYDIRDYNSVKNYYGFKD